MDYSTIDLKALKSLKTFRLPGATTDDVTNVSSGKYTWSIQALPGNGCSGDPPGYPSYFTRNVYRNGDHPHSGPTLVITYEGKHYVIATYDDDSWDEVKERLQKLWKPLHPDHERVKMWMSELYRHNKHCYRDDASGELVIYPVPAYKLRTFTDDVRFNDEWRDKAKSEVESYNTNIEAMAKYIAQPENHAAYRIIRRFYPTLSPSRQLIEAQHIEMRGFWWETEAKQPTPAECTPRNGIGVPDGIHVGHGWCQWCGWKGDEG
jgi:hypothetical protein